MINGPDRYGPFGSARNRDPFRVDADEEHAQAWMSSGLCWLTMAITLIPAAFVGVNQINQNPNKAGVNVAEPKSQENPPRDKQVLKMSEAPNPANNRVVGDEAVQANDGDKPQDQPANPSDQKPSAEDR